MPDQEQLKSSIMDKDMCSGCGMCVGLCPYIMSIRDSVRVIHSCGLKDGICFNTCPKASLNVGELDTSVFGAPRKDQALGVFRGIYFARALNKSSVAQYGGVASGLMAFALEQGLVDGAVVTGGSAMEPKPLLAKTAGEVLACAGSKYTAVPTLSAFNAAVRDGYARLGLVGRPCQVEAVRKMQAGKHMESHLDREKAAVLTVGIFCFWSLRPGFYDFLAEKSGGARITRVDIPLEGLTVTAGGNTDTWPVEEIRQYIKDTCNSCLDSTSEWADISVGSTEYDPQWNTLVIRTVAGQSLVDLAAQKGVIEMKPYPEERLPILKRAAINKKMRVLGAEEKPGYLAIPDEYITEIKKQWEVLQP